MTPRSKLLPRVRRYLREHAIVTTPEIREAMECSWYGAHNVLRALCEHGEIVASHRENGCIIWKVIALWPDEEQFKLRYLANMGRNPRQEDDDNLQPTIPGARVIRCRHNQPIERGRTPWLRPGAGYEGF